MKRAFRTLLSLTLFLALTAGACSGKCDEWQQGGGKTLKYQDSTGNNLVFGPMAIYYPDSIFIETATGERSLIGSNPTQGTLNISLNNSNSRFLIFLPNNVVDTLDLDLYEEKSEDCCGYYWASNGARLNGVSIPNSNPIAIIR
jgi:hypothetical protein